MTRYDKFVLAFGLVSIVFMFIALGYMLMSLDSNVFLSELKNLAMPLGIFILGAVVILALFFAWMFLPLYLWDLKRKVSDWFYGSFTENYLSRLHHFFNRMTEVMGTKTGRSIMDVVSGICIIGVLALWLHGAHIMLGTWMVVGCLCIQMIDRALDKPKTNVQA